MNTSNKSNQISRNILANTQPAFNTITASNSPSLNQRTLFNTENTNLDKTNHKTIPFKAVKEEIKGFLKQCDKEQNKVSKIAKLFNSKSYSTMKKPTLYNGVKDMTESWMFGKTEMLILYGKKRNFLSMNDKPNKIKIDRSFKPKVVGVENTKDELDKIIAKNGLMKSKVEAKLRKLKEN